MMKTTAERLASRGLGEVTLPVSGERVRYHMPRTRDALEAGIFPLVVASMKMDEIDPDEREHVLAEADRNAVRLICACCYDPAFTERVTARKGRNEAPVDSLCADDFTALHMAIMEMVGQRYMREERDEAPHEEDNRQAIALACKAFGLDPTTVDDWEPARTQRLLEYLVLTAKKE